MDDRKHDAAWHSTPSPFGPDGHLTQTVIEQLAQEQLDTDAEARLAAVRRRVLAYAVAPWWQRAWWRLTRGGPS